MIFVGDESERASPVQAPPACSVQQLLAACAAEMRRQAGAMAALDATLARLVEQMRRQVGPIEAALRLPPEALHGLQRADHLRQEVEGLAGVLELLVRAGRMDAMISTDLLRACAPLADLQDRLLSGHLPPTGGGST